jgi:hypothetical protein
VGGLQEEAQRSLGLMTQLIEGAIAAGGVTTAQIAAYQGGQLRALGILEKLTRRREIHDHPDFDGLIEDLTDAVEEVLGPNAPTGLRARIAEAFEVRQLERLDSKTRRAAA